MESTIVTNAPMIGEQPDSAPSLAWRFRLILLEKVGRHAPVGPEAAADIAGDDRQRRRDASDDAADEGGCVVRL